LDMCNGITSYAMNYYRALKNDFIIDFVVHENANETHSIFYDEITESGGLVYFVGNASIKKLLTLNKKIDAIFRMNKYDIIHCHLLNLSPFYFKQGKKFKIKHRILHSHATKYAEKKSRVLRNWFLGKIGISRATCFMACSKMAGDFLYKKKPYILINNGINGQLYKYDATLATQYRDALHLKNDYVIGHIGRFSEQKNHKFILDVFEQVYLQNHNVTLLLIGDGPLYESIQKDAKNLKSFAKIQFLGTRKDVNHLLSAMDILILPSLFEGFPVISIEAQFNGVPMLISSNVTQECGINSNIKFLPLEKKIWVEKLSKQDEARVEPSKEINEYDIEHCYSKLRDEYMKMN
ncbi:MAG: glycosyltransferase, partial [Anaeroplasmataceae bacterium]|nr:glycosyltransferase [Anaeroplasmataceae bacterium]